MVTLVISDVPGDDPAVIASGPTVPDRHHRAMRCAILERYRHRVAGRRWRLARSGAAETPKPGDPRLRAHEIRMIATPQLSLEAAAAVARAAGVTPLILRDAIEGEAREVGTVHAGIARRLRCAASRSRKPVRAAVGRRDHGDRARQGRGGRNIEFLLALALGIDGDAGIHALAGDTDGIDGTEDNAGAFADGDECLRGLPGPGLDGAALLDRNDALDSLRCDGRYFRTGPTGTNVNDFRAILVQKRRAFTKGIGSVLKSGTKCVMAS